MGLILDSTVLIAAERKGRNARQILAEIATNIAGEDVALSVVTILELAHGAARANTPQRRAARLQYIHELMLAVPVHPISPLIALLAGQIDGESTAKGISLPLSDLLIGVTALHLGFSVATGNARHFLAIPGLKVITL
jgi:predicted nucleic acid-binding protein